MIFCNTTPFIALAGVAHLGLLPSLFGEMHLVPSVIEECAVGERGMISSFARLVADMRANGDFYHSALVARLTALAGE